MSFTLQTVSSLEKVMPAAALGNIEKHGEMLSNEKFAFQVVGNSDVENLCGLQLRWSGTLAPYMTVRHVDYVPALRTCMPGHDDFFLDDAAQVFPDPLRPLFPEGESVTYHLNSSFWVDVFNPEGIPAGDYSAKFVLEDADGKLLAETDYSLTVLSGRLAESDLYTTNWLHCDGICNYYGIEPMSEPFWNRLEQFISCAAEHGFTMLYTPLFTPPLDTAVGRERMTIQTVSVEKHGERYEFDFSNLERYLQIARSCGIRYFEFSHLFSQWGARACPKVEVTENGQRQNLFGWDTPSDSPAYRGFLRAFLPRLVDFLKERGLDRCSFFHLSDEPFEESINIYREIHAFLKPLSGGIPYMDALSHYAYYESGCVDIPVVGIAYTEEFERHGVSHWIYNCCGPDNEHLSNRFICMPSLRNRVLGLQMYRSGVKGYLHWGFNFYNTVFSYHAIDPFISTDADRNLPAGDPFIVYPGKDCPWASIRLETFLHGMQDYRALLALEQKIGREKVCDILDEYGYKNYREYPIEESTLIALRSHVNAILSKGEL